MNSYTSHRRCVAAVAALGLPRHPIPVAGPILAVRPRRPRRPHAQPVAPSPTPQAWVDTFARAHEATVNGAPVPFRSPSRAAGRRTQLRGSCQHDGSAGRAGSWFHGTSTHVCDRRLHATRWRRGRSDRRWTDRRVRLTMRSPAPRREAIPTPRSAAAGKLVTFTAPTDAEMAACGGEFMASGRHRGRPERRMALGGGDSTTGSASSTSEVTASSSIVEQFTGHDGRRT